MQFTCIIIPCYNEANRLPVNFLADFYAQPGSEKVHFCFVNDGSSDKTIEVLRTIEQQYPAKVIVVDQTKNTGKAEAIRNGVQYVKEKGYTWIGYFDADLATPLNELFHFDEFASTDKYTFICGSRMKRLGARIERDTVRHYIGRIFATLASMSLKLPVYDTQCGAKLVHISVINEAFGEQFMTRWLFDVEIFARLIQAKGRTYVIEHSVEVPLFQWSEIAGSKVKWTHALDVPIQLWKIRKRYKL